MTGPISKNDRKKDPSLSTTKTVRKVVILDTLPGCREVFPMAKVKNKMKNLKEFLPGETRATYEFAMLFADYIQGHQTLYPFGFIRGAKLLLFDIARGVDGHTGKPMKTRFRVNAALLSRHDTKIPAIAEATCPPEFAAEVKKVYYQ